MDQIKSQETAPRHIYLSNLMQTKLPFAKGVMLPKHHKNKNVMLDLPIKKFLIDEDKIRAKIESNKKKIKKKSRFQQRLEEVAKQQQKKRR